MPIIVVAEAALHYADVGLEFDETQLVNLVQVAREGGIQQIAEDTESRALYLTRTYNRTDLLFTSDAASADYAALILHISGQPELRFATLTINPLRDPGTLFPQVLGREIGDRITIIRTPPGGGSISRDVFIRGISHDFDASSVTWLTTWVLQSATPFTFEHEFLRLDDAELGKLDTYALGF